MQQLPFLPSASPRRSFKVTSGRVNNSLIRTFIQTGLAGIRAPLPPAARTQFPSKRGGGGTEEGGRVSAHVSGAAGAAQRMIPAARGSRPAAAGRGPRGRAWPRAGRGRAGRRGEGRYPPGRRAEGPRGRGRKRGAGPPLSPRVGQRVPGAAPRPFPWRWRGRPGGGGAAGSWASVAGGPRCLRAPLAVKVSAR